jgi:hypothetical protein
MENEIKTEEEIEEVVTPEVPAEAEPVEATPEVESVVEETPTEEVAA